MDERTSNFLHSDNSVQFDLFKQHVSEVKHKCFRFNPENLDG